MNRRRVMTIAACFAAGIILASIWAVNRTNSAPGRTELIVAAASSLKSSLDAAAADYAAANPNVKVTMSYGATGSLKQQIEQGVPADLFFFADTKQSDELAAGHLVDHAAVLLTNRLVLVVPADSPHQIAAISDLASAGVKRIAVGQPDTVPAGRYAKETLVSAKIWDDVQTKLVFAKDVRQVLTYVETGNADAGFVYRSDALNNGRIITAVEVDNASHAPIRYPAGIVSATKHRPEAVKLLAYLEDRDAMNTFKAHGFAPARP